MRNFLESEPLLGVAEIRKNKTLLPDARGLYGLFFKIPPGDAPVDGSYHRDGMSLLYIGTAGADLGRDGTLRKRLGGNHLGGNERRSTVCQTLAALLPIVVGPAVAKLERGSLKFHTSVTGSSELQRWMDANVSACWQAYARPSELEEELVGRYKPPLNLDFCDHPFVETLRKLRAQRRAKAI